MAQFFLFPVSQWLDNSGNPLASGTIDWYVAGTTTHKDTYTDSTGATPNANPVVLDTAGRAQIWLAAAAYKFIVKTSGGTTLLTVDNYNPSNVNTTVTALTSTGDVVMQQSTAATSGANQTSNTFEIDANIWNGSASVADKWQFQDVVGTGTNPTNVLDISHSGSTGQSAVRIPASIPLEFSTDVAISRSAANKLQVGVTAGAQDNSGTVDATEYLVAGVASSGTGGLAHVTSPIFVTPTLGVATATSVNKVTITAPAASATLTIADGKTLTASKTLTLTGTDSTTMTFPSTSATIARTDAGQTFTGVQVMTSPTINGTPTGTGIPTVTLKKGSGTGNYTHSGDTNYTQVDGTNLTYTVTIPTGWNLMIICGFRFGTNTAAVACNVAIADGGTVKVETVNTTIAAGVLTSGSLAWMIAGDGASHTIDLRYKTSNSADAVSIGNSSATDVATMVFLLTPSN